jgi:hypothetical protein
MDDWENFVSGDEHLMCICSLSVATKITLAKGCSFKVELQPGDEQAFY